MTGSVPRTLGRALAPVVLLAAILGVPTGPETARSTAFFDRILEAAASAGNEPAPPDEGTSVEAPPSGAPEVTSSAPPASSVPAFPGAEGFGATALGGRGGRVIAVTSLDDAGPGTLREAIETPGPRIIVFRVGGTIEVREPLDVVDPFVTLAGQTAPGDGISVRSDAGLGLPPLRILTHDVVVRHLRVRAGPSHRPSCCNDGIRIGDDPEGPSPRSVYNVILDHVSSAWSSGENVSIGGGATRKVTVQWSILTEPIAHNHASVLRSGLRAYHNCALLVSGGARKVSIHHNLLAHSGCRSPRIVMGRGFVDLVNNVVFDWTSDHSNWRVATELHSGEGHGRAPDGVLRANVIGNYYKLPDGWLDPERPHVISISNNQGRRSRVYLRGNMLANLPHSLFDQELLVNRTGPAYTTDAPHETPPIRTMTAFQAFAFVLAQAGATLPARDAVDHRAVRDADWSVRRRVEFHPNEVGGWPFMDDGLAPRDRDGDGMPDGWEHDHDFDLRDAGDGPGDADGDGYTNVEEYLNATDPHGAD